MNNEKFTITVSADMQIASIEQIDNTVVVLVEGVKIEPLKWQPKEGDEVHRVIFDRNENKFIIHSFTWQWGCKFHDCIKPSLKEAQKLCSILNLALYEK